MTLDDILAPALRRETIFEQRQYVEEQLCKLASNKQLYLTDAKKIYDLHTKNLVFYVLTGVAINEDREMESCPIPDEIANYFVKLRALTDKKQLVWKGPARVVRVVRKRPIYQKQLRKLDFDDKGYAFVTVQKAIEVLQFYGKGFNAAQNQLMMQKTWLCEECKPDNYDAEYAPRSTKSQRILDLIGDKLDEKQLDKLIKSIKAS